MKNMFLDCLHGRLDNPRTDLSEQLYIITKLSRHDVADMYRKQCDEPSLPDQIRNALYRDGIPSRTAVQQWLKKYAHKYPMWSRARPPGIGCIGILLFVLPVAVIALSVPPLEIITWVLIVIGLLFASVVIRHIGNVAWRKHKIKRVSKELRQEGITSASPLTGGAEEFRMFVFYWILARRFDGDTRPAIELAKEALSIWEGVA